MTERILCNATSDAVPGMLNLWRVNVYGVSPYQVTREYQIPAIAEGIAAQEGIRRFVAEMEENPPT